ncbi:MAG: hypothetical protein K8R87_09545 [Verrucomicrobia bacterium]|nr:hypothetical protein [Verrucomicrobiota bacterium]
MSKILLAALFGAIICVAWGAISWMGLEWHSGTLNRFADEAAVGEIIKADAGAVLEHNGQTSGMFMLPLGTVVGERAPSEESKARNRAALQAHADGPYFYGIIRPGPKPMNMIVNLSLAFARSFAACFIIALLLSWTMRLDYVQRIFFCAIAGLFAGLVSDVPLLIWFEAPLHHTLINLADHLCEWFLAGLVIAALVPGREIWERIR